MARDLIENSQASYNRLGNLISDARLAGLISWDAIEDRTRNLMGLSTYNTPQGMIRSKLRPSDYRTDLWADQPMRPEVWVEKDALSDVVGQMCNRLRVDFFACRGYVSQSEQWRAGQRLKDYVLRGQTPIIFHLGDHDPSGIDMTRDNRDRLSLFCGQPVQVTRLALHRSQVDELHLPPFWAKLTDPRARDYVAQHGDQSWELDALPPPYMVSLIEDAVSKLRDPQKWEAALARENEDRRELEELIAMSGGEDDKEDEE